jgi:hypothetical protein
MCKSLFDKFMLITFNLLINNVIKNNNIVCYFLRLKNRNKKREQKQEKQLSK